MFGLITRLIAGVALLAMLPALSAKAEAPSGDRKLSIAVVYSALLGDWRDDLVKEIDHYSTDVASARGVTNYFKLDAGLNLAPNRYSAGVKDYFGVWQTF